MNFTNKFLLMQVNDSVFPIGGYTQSYGLETYISKGLIKNSSDALKYIENNLYSAFIYTDLLATSLAFDYAKKGDIEKLVDLDETLEVIKSPKEIRSASVKLGSRFVKVIKTSKLELENNIFNKYQEKESELKIASNHSVAYGVFCAAIGVEKDEALAFYIYSTCSAMVTNSVKTVPLSQTDGQIMLTSFSNRTDEIIEKVKELDESYLGLSMPGYDIRCMQHETLYSRLYMS